VLRRGVVADSAATYNCVVLRLRRPPCIVARRDAIKFLLLDVIAAQTIDVAGSGGQALTMLARRQRRAEEGNAARAHHAADQDERSEVLCFHGLPPLNVFSINAT
jgi:hypothetical protein